MCIRTFGNQLNAVDKLQPCKLCECKSQLPRSGQMDWGKGGHCTRRLCWCNQLNAVGKLQSGKVCECKFQLPRSGQMDWEKEGYIVEEDYVGAPSFEKLVKKSYAHLSDL